MKMQVNTMDILTPVFLSHLKDVRFLEKVRKELDEKGLVCIPEFLQANALNRLQNEVLLLEKSAQTSNEGGNRKYSVKKGCLNGTVIDDLSRCPYMLGLINGILMSSVGNVKPIVDRPIGYNEVVPGLNIMRGTGDVTAFHFDGTFLNVLIPVFIPKLSGPNRGQLTIYPNIRSFHRNLFDRFLIPILCRSGLYRFIFPRMEVDYEVGNVYLFYGYRSYHGVESPSAEGLRCTTNITIGAGRF